MRAALTAPLLDEQASGGRWRGGQRLQMFLRQFGSELVSPRLDNASSIVPGDMDWISPRSSANGGGGGGRGGGVGHLGHSLTVLDPSDDGYNDVLGIQERRSLTAEFGSGSDTNPALFAPSNTGRGVVPGSNKSSGGSGSGGVGVGGDRSGRGGWVLDPSGRRKWVYDRSDFDSFGGGGGGEGRGNAVRNAFVRDAEEREDDEDDDASLRAAAAAREDWSFIGDGSVSATGGEDDGRHGHGRGPERGRRHAPPGDRGGHNHAGQSRSVGGRGAGAGGRLGVGRDVVDGYVSLGSRQTHRWGPDDDRSGGLLLPRPQGGGQGARGPPGGGSESALSLFRKQLYEEGRGKGTLASM